VVLAVAGLAIVVVSLTSAVQKNIQTTRMQTLQEQNTQLTESTRDLVETNTELTAENQRLTIELSNRFTGGDSYINMAALESVSNKITYGFYFHGEYDLRHLRVIIWDQEKKNELMRKLAIDLNSIGHADAFTSIQKQAIIYDETHQHYSNTGAAFMTIGNLPDVAPGESAAHSYHSTASNFKSNGFLFLHRNDDGKLLSAEILKKEDGVLRENPESYPRLNSPNPTHVPYPDWTQF